MMLSGKSQKIILDEFSFLISTTEVEINEEFKYNRNSQQKRTKQNFFLKT